MGFVVIEVECVNDAVGQLNSLISDNNAHEGAQKILNFISALSSGSKDGNITIVVRSTTSSPVASGGGSSAVYTLA